MKPSPSRLFHALAVGLVGVALAGIHTLVRAEAAQSLPMDELKVFSEVFGKIKSDYVEPVDDRVLLNNAVRGMLNGLDPHSTYLDPEAHREVNIDTRGEFGGLGIEVTIDDNGLVKVVAPIDGTPAARAGILAGDLIVRLDGTPVKGMSLNEAVSRMRGKPGTTLDLTIARRGLQNPIEITIERAVIHIDSVSAQLLEARYAYVRVAQFQAGTAASLRRELSRVKKEAGGTLDGLVLDLRNNPGGVLEGAVDVSDVFLRQGVIVSTRGRTEDSRITFNATPKDHLDDAAMVVLVNQGSASAAEIVAGALQDHNRAVILGTKTFGKGSVQTILPMHNGAALKITTARYYTPNDRSIQARGIIPDVLTGDVDFADKATDKAALSEAKLAGHLQGDTATEKGADAADRLASPPQDRDYEVRAALNLLKGINIARRYAD
ncbi:MAG: S41 family peptidase [Pseudomonadota bacterium]|nr:S41 family peptidase [Pseudomonadota bacterium]